MFYSIFIAAAMLVGCGGKIHGKWQATSYHNKPLPAKVCGQKNGCITIDSQLFVIAADLSATRTTSESSEAETLTTKRSFIVQRAGSQKYTLQAQQNKQEWSCSQQSNLLNCPRNNQNFQFRKVDNLDGRWTAQIYHGKELPAKVCKKRRRGGKRCEDVQSQTLQLTNNQGTQQTSKSRRDEDRSTNSAVVFRPMAKAGRYNLTLDEKAFSCIHTNEHLDCHSTTDSKVHYRYHRPVSLIGTWKASIHSDKKMPAKFCSTRQKNTICETITAESLTFATDKTASYAISKQLSARKGQKTLDYIVQQHDGTSYTLRPKFYSGKGHNELRCKLEGKKLICHSTKDSTITFQYEHQGSQ